MIFLKNNIELGFTQEQVNYFCAFTRQNRVLNQNQAAPQDYWNENFYRTYAPVKYKQIEDAYGDIMTFMEDLERNREHEEFIKLMGKLQITLPFVKVLKQSPIYNKFMKEVLSK